MWPFIGYSIVYMRIFNIRKNEVVLVTPHQGLGDHILCNGIYRELADQYKIVFITVKRTYRSQISRMLSDLDNIIFINIPISRSWTSTRVIQIIARILTIKIVGLGSYGKNFFPPNLRFDENFYNQANVNFENRWTKFRVDRNITKEEELYELLNCKAHSYIFLHEDVSRNFIINRDFLSNEFDIVTPSAGSDKFSIFDYRKVIENASEIHVIESAFAAFIESLELSIPLFAHRYARPHASNDYRHEFTYKKNWVIITEKFKLS